jgi:hypothetical protein
MVSWHDGDTFPAIFDPPAAAYEVPSLRKVGIGTSIPASGPFPYLLVALDSVAVESAGQTSDWITLHMKLVTALQENNERSGCSLRSHANRRHSACGGQQRHARRACG